MINFRLNQQYLHLRTKHDQLALKRECVSIILEFMKSNAYSENSCQSITLVSEIFDMIFIAFEWLYNQSGDNCSTEN